MHNTRVIIVYVRILRIRLRDCNRGHAAAIGIQPSTTVVDEIPKSYIGT